MRIFVADRVHERHPELTADDVATAFRSVMVDAERARGTWLAVGLDSHGRNVELLYKVVDGDVLIYHAMTPPTKKFLREIEQLRSKR